MKIQNELITGCDKNSRVYCNSFNALEPIFSNVEIKGNLKGTNAIDRSALGLYIGKYVEQELNSTVVQLLRQILGIDMPEYYCKYDPSHRNVIVETGRTIDLNGYYSRLGVKSLKTITIGEVYYALVELISDTPESFIRYSWLNDGAFLDSVRQLNDFRNKVAHIGSIISVDELNNGLAAFNVFLQYSKKLNQIKENLNPDYSLTEPVESDTYSKPNAPLEKWRQYKELRAIPYDNLSDEDERIMIQLAEEYDWSAVVYTGSNKKKGLKDVAGNILIPALYDGFQYSLNSIMPDVSIVAINNGKMGLVKTDGSGKICADFIYDAIERIATGNQLWDDHIGYKFKKDNSICWGLMSIEGDELLPCILDEVLPVVSLAVYYRRGDLLGVWPFVSSDICTQPIYENIEWQYNDDHTLRPLSFILNGVNGCVKSDGTFVPYCEYCEDDHYLIDG